MQSQPITHFNRLVAITNAHFPFNIVLVLHLTPRPSIIDVQDALNALQARHPILRSRVKPDPEYSLVFDVKEKMHVEEVWLENDSEWKTYAENKLNTQLDLSVGPLMQCLILNSKNQNSATLLFTINHIILDARSAPELLKDFLQLLGGELKAPLEPIPMAPEISTVLPPRFRGARRTVGIAGFILKKIGEEVAYRVRSIGLADSPLQPEGSCKILTFAYSKEETLAIIRKSRNIGVTVNSILISALTVSTCRVLYPNKTRPVRLICFADLRSFLSPPIEDKQLGNAVSMLQIDETLPENTDAWEFSKKAHTALTKAYRSGEKFYSLLLSDKLIQMVIRMNRIRLGTSALSYTGPLNIPEKYGPYMLSGFHAFISNNHFGPVTSLQARLYKEQLWLDILYLDSDMGPETAEQIKQELKHQLTK